MAEHPNEPTTFSEVVRRFDDAYPYHRHADKCRASGLPVPTREAWAADVAEAKRSAKRVDLLLVKFCEKPGPMLDACGVGSLDEREVAIRLIKGVREVLKRVAGVSTAESEAVADYLQAIRHNPNGAAAIPTEEPSNG